MEDESKTLKRIRIDFDFAKELLSYNFDELIDKNKRKAYEAAKEQLSEKVNSLIRENHRLNSFIEARESLIQNMKQNNEKRDQLNNKQNKLKTDVKDARFLTKTINDENKKKQERIERKF
jgi:hypothetical protein